LQAIVLGLIQGLTEFAPISSSGHLILVPWLFDWPILSNEALNKTFDVALHIGTFVGAAFYLRHDIAKYLVAWARSIRARSVRTTDERLAWALVVGTIPGVVVGAAAEGVIVDKLGAPWLIALMLAVFAVILYVVDRVFPQRRELGDIGLRDGLLLGMAQAVALQPGVSRSGVTITAARALQLKREDAARFSFLLSLPIIGGAAVYEGYQLVAGTTQIPEGFVAPFLWGMAASAVSGFLVVWALLAYLRRYGFGPFVVYRLAVAGVVFGLTAAGVRPATL
jgi:undecaprenyl-diphosphatase